MSTNRVIRCFLNVRLSSGHVGLAEFAKKNKLNVTALNPGEYVVFINRAQDRVKVYASNNIIAYLRLPSGQRLDLRVIQQIPSAFNGTKINYDEALRETLLRELKRPRVRAVASPLTTAKAAQAAGITERTTRSA